MHIAIVIILIVTILYQNYGIVVIMVNRYYHTALIDISIHHCVMIKKVMHKDENDMRRCLYNILDLNLRPVSSHLYTIVRH